MSGTPKPHRLKKELGLFDVYAIATGATLSSGFFLLPGLAAASAGAAIPISYLLAALIILPGLVSKTELATAMPRSGGEYYFLDRSMGPLMGTIGGFGTWIALSLKAAFALIGIGAYVSLFAPDFPMVPLAAGVALLFGVINVVGAKKTTSFQGFLVTGLLLLLAWFTGLGAFDIRAEYFSGFLEVEAASIVSTAGLVVVSYMGLTKVASVAEEVENPERNLPLGMFLAYGTAILVYSIGTSVMVGVVGVETLARGGGDLTPVATVAEALVGPWGSVVMTVAAILAFSSVANAGILSASRYPLAMSRDNLLPATLSKIGSRGTPHTSIFLTVGVILLFVTVFDPTKIAKLAGAFLLMMFALSCVAVVVMRESGIDSYDPGFRSPFYPGLQILGVLAPFWLIIEMGLLPTIFTGGLIFFGAMWYTYYARGRVQREGAILHVFERLGRGRYEGLDRELREIMKERGGVREADPFDELVTGAVVLDISGHQEFGSVVGQASTALASVLEITAAELREGFIMGSKVGMTPVSHGAALPHLRLASIDEPQLALVRLPGGMARPTLEAKPSTSDEGAHATGSGPVRSEEPIRAAFFLVSPEEDPGQHLRILAQIARRVDAEDFMERWLGAQGEQELKEVLLRDDRYFAFEITRGRPSETLIGARLSDVPVPEETLIAMVRRAGEIIVPRGGMIFQEGDRLTIIGDPDGVQELRIRFEIGGKDASTRGAGV